MMTGILGIDLGTSSIKLLLNGRRIGEKYTVPGPAGWWDALCRAAKQIGNVEIKAIGLSSQVGTYVINGEDVIGWSDPAGQAELPDVLNAFDVPMFLDEISMPHPRIISYPLPRLLHIRQKYEHIQQICMPKDLLLHRLTGNWVSDPYSWRGLANLQKKAYSKRMLDWLGIAQEQLPPLIDPTTQAGTITKAAAEATGLPEGTPVFTGCNDFFAGLLGMGMLQSGELFDITGTSEHLGLITDEMYQNDGLVCGPYFSHNVYYGVTASSGASMDFGMKLHSFKDLDPVACLKRNPPLFLPYLNGERAPIWDADARGVFFGLSGQTTPEDMAYAVLEGTAMSIYHIYTQMGCPAAKCMRITGGAGRDPVLGLLKASLFGIPVQPLKQADASATGAQMLAAIGCGMYQDMEEAIGALEGDAAWIEPDAALTDLLRARFEVYRELYPALKSSFQAFHGLGSKE